MRPAALQPRFQRRLQLRLAAPRRQAFAGALLALAVLVWLNTIDSRYHYAADGLAAVTMREPVAARIPFNSR